MSLPQPVPLGLRKSFGFGDRLGLATPGHLAAVIKSDFAPVFAQQSVREMERTQRTPEEILSAAREAVARHGFTQPWGADADHHKTAQDAQKAAAAGFTLFTIDPSAYVVNEADRLPPAELADRVKKLEAEGIFAEGDWHKTYLKKQIHLTRTFAISFNQTILWRAVVKYGRAIAHVAEIAGHIARACAGRPYEIEVSIDESDAVTSPHEHLFFGLELRRRQVPLISLAPRFIGEFEKGIDYRGDLKEFEVVLRDHVAIAQYCGPYKISIHSGSDKFSIYPIIGRVCGDLLHVKTAGTSYLEALRVVARAAPQLFAEVTEFCRSRFEADRKSYHISTTLKEINSLPPYASPKDEPVYLDQRPGRQLLHVTFGSVLTIGVDKKGRRFKEGILEVLAQHADLHHEFLESHFTRHLSLLNQG